MDQAEAARSWTAVDGPELAHAARSIHLIVLSTPKSAQPILVPKLRAPRAIFLFSLEPWGDMWYSKHHYAAFLAKHHPVYFISLPDRWRWTDLFSIRAKVRTVKEGVHVVEYRNNLPLRLLPSLLARWVTWLNAWKLRRLAPTEDLLFWCFHPAPVVESRILRRKGSKVVYHVVDPYQSLPNDSSFAQEADLVAAINPWYVDYYGRLNANCLLVPHGVRGEDRMDRADMAQHHRDTWGDYAVMAAGINYRTNYALLMEVARRHPELHLVVVGQLFAVEPALQRQRDALFQLPNVSYVGVKHPDALRDIIRGARMGLVTYDFEPTRSIPVTGVGTPLKVITYLSQGCPVVSTLNSYVPALDGRGSFKAEDPTHFVELVGEVLSGVKKVDHEAVSTYLDSVDYGRLTQRILTGLGYPVDTEREPTPLAPMPGDTRAVIPVDSPILVISNEEWDGPRYSKHRYALALTAHRNVLFLDPVKPWRPSHFFQWRIAQRPTPEGVTILSYHNTIPLLGGRFGGLNDHFVSYRLRRFLRRTGHRWPVFWSFDPSRLLKPGQLESVMAVYHCADDHTFRWESEQVLARHCDHVFCIARDLMPRFLPLNASVHHLPHGLAASDLARDSTTSPAPRTSVVALYIGNINDRHDFRIWDRLFSTFPDIQFLVVGPVNVSDPLGQRLIHDQPYPNVRFSPAVPHDQLVPLIADADFGFLYLRQDHPANRISSQKVIQFLAQGKPFFCSWLSEYEHAGPAVHLSNDAQSAVEAIRKFRTVGDSAEARAERLRLAHQQLFPSLFTRLPFRL